MPVFRIGEPETLFEKIKRYKEIINNCNQDNCADCQLGRDSDDKCVKRFQDLLIECTEYYEKDIAETFEKNMTDFRLFDEETNRLENRISDLEDELAKYKG